MVKVQKAQKWCIQSEAFGLTKKKESNLVTVIVGHFLLEKRRLKIQILCVVSGNVTSII